MSYTNRSATQRTDEEYSTGAYVPDHQTRLSLVVQYNIGLVTRFPLDYMHLVCLGVTRRFLKHLTKTATEYRISHSTFTKIGDRLAKLVPSEFARSSPYIDRFKATEFRQLLLYTGLVALEDFVASQVYHTFVCLSLAMSILLCDDIVSRLEQLDVARGLLSKFEC